MASNNISVQEKRRKIKFLFRGYTHMTHALEKELETIGIHVARSKKHLKLYGFGKMYIAPASASDFRSGSNLASVICRDLS